MGLSNLRAIQRAISTLPLPAAAIFKSKILPLIGALQTLQTRLPVQVAILPLAIASALLMLTGILSTLPVIF